MDKKWESLYDHSRERNFQAMKYRYVGSLRKIFSHLGVVQQISQWASLFECFYKAKQWKVPMLRGFTGPFPDVFSQIPFKVSSGHVQILMGWDQIICFPPRASWRTPGTFLTLRSSWQKKVGHLASQSPGTTTNECRSSIVTWFMCHTWCLGRTPGELHGVQVHGEHGLPQQVAINGVFSPLLHQISFLSD